MSGLRTTPKPSSSIDQPIMSSVSDHMCSPTDMTRGHVRLPDAGRRISPATSGRSCRAAFGSRPGHVANSLVPDDLHDGVLGEADAAADKPPRLHEERPR